MTVTLKKFLSLGGVAFLAACGGGGGGSEPPAPTPSAPTTRYTVYVVDDYVIGGTATVTDAASGAVVTTRTTGALGVLSFDLPATGNYTVSVTGGVLDADGDPATTADQAAFVGTVKGMLVPALATYAQVLGAASTGVLAHVGADAAKYESAMRALNAALPSLLDAAQPPLASVLSVQRTVGYESLVAELSDDGQINFSQGVAPNAVAAAVNADARARVLNMADAKLMACVEAAIGKEGPSLADVQALTELVCPDQQVYSLDGIQALTRLQTLVLRNNAISSVAPLVGLKEMQYLDLGGNRVASVADIATAFGAETLINVDDNCLSGLPAATRGEWLFAASQRSSCNKVVRDPVLFNVYRRDDAKFTVVYRIASAASCAMDYSATLANNLQCDNAVHRLELAVPYPGAAEFVRLRLDGKTYGVYPVDLRYTPGGNLEALLQQGFFNDVDRHVSSERDPVTGEPLPVYQVRQTIGRAGVWRDQVWTSLNGAPYQCAVGGGDGGFSLASTGWVPDSPGGTYSLRPDGLWLVTGSDFGSSGAVGSLRAGDLAGKPMSVFTGLNRAEAAQLFPAGSVGVYDSFTQLGDQYRAFAATNEATTLAGFVGVHRTQGDTTVLWGWNDTHFSFNGPLAASGGLTFWNPETRTSLGAGTYAVRTVQPGVDVLEITGFSTGALAYAEQRNAFTNAETVKSRRPILTVIGGQVFYGMRSVGGAASSVSAPGLNRVAVNAVLAARGYPGLPARPPAGSGCN